MPGNYFRVSSKQDVEWLSGPAMMYGKVVVLATKGHETFVGGDWLVIVRL